MHRDRAFTVSLALASRSPPRVFARRVRAFARVESIVRSSRARRSPVVVARARASSSSHLDPPARHRHDRSSKHRDRRRASPSAVASRRVASSRRRRRPDAPESPDRRVTNGRIARKSRNAVLYFFRREVTPKALKRERDRAARESVFSRRAVSVNARSVARKRRLILSHTARRNSNLSTWVACTRPGRACPAPPCPTSARRRAG